MIRNKDNPNCQYLVYDPAMLYLEGRMSRDRPLPISSGFVKSKRYHGRVPDAVGRTDTEQRGKGGKDTHNAKRDDLLHWFEA